MVNQGKKNNNKKNKIEVLLPPKQPETYVTKLTVNGYYRVETMKIINNNKKSKQATLPYE